MSAGKGDKRRPNQVDQKTVDDNWDKIFGKKVKPEKEVESKETEKDK